MVLLVTAGQNCISFIYEDIYEQCSFCAVVLSFEPTCDITFSLKMSELFKLKMARICVYVNILAYFFRGICQDLR